MFAFLDKQKTVASPGFNRWLVPPAALCIHLSIGQVYAWSVFNTPLTQLIGVEESIKGQDWSPATVIIIFSLAIAVVAPACAFGGAWLENVGPRKAMFISALCFAGGFFISAMGTHWHSIWLVYLGYGILGGTGLGLGYISPVSTLIKWFPDRPGMATGMAIMGFGGGAMIASPLSSRLMDYYHSSTDRGVTATFVTLGIIYLVFMMVAAFTVRIPAPGWKPAGFMPSLAPKKMMTTRHVHADQSIKTPQFYLLWIMLCFNVTAGIAILSKAANMIQDIFGKNADEAAGFVGLLSIFNMAGRFIWSSASDYLGRKITYGIYFGLGMVLYAFLPTIGSWQNLVLFVIINAVIVSMYGGGFATIPAYLRDMFGTMHVGAIHGRLLTAWSVAGVLGPILLTKWAEHQKEAGVPKAQSYDLVLYFMSGLLLMAFICNFFMSPVDAKHHHPEENL